MSMRRLMTLIQSKPFMIAVALLTLAALGLLNFRFGEHMNFSLLYVIPIGIASWFLGRSAGLVFSLASVVVWFLADKVTTHLFCSFLNVYWNAAALFLGFAGASLVLSALRRALRKEKDSARKDSLTDLPNRLGFYELAQHETERCRRSRRPLTVAILDCDNFKTINDRMGHRTGDALLKALADTLRSTLRGQDIAARIGGDEFVILFPELDAGAARMALERMRAGLMATMQERGWVVTFSIGAVTLARPSGSLEEILHKADEVMYSVKLGNKDGLRHEEFVSGDLEVSGPVSERLPGGLIETMHGNGYPFRR